MVPYTHRKYVRHHVRTECVVTSEETGRVLADEALDMSYDGVLARGGWMARPGERVRVSLRVPATEIWVEGSGYVARLIRGNRQGDRGHAVGIHVRRMHGMSRALLTSVLRLYPRPKTLRGGRRDYARMVERISQT